jgi:hypothetical protein
MIKVIRDPFAATFSPESLSWLQAGERWSRVAAADL